MFEIRVTELLARLLWCRSHILFGKTKNYFLVHSDSDQTLVIFSPWQNFDLLVWPLVCLFSACFNSQRLNPSISCHVIFSEAKQRHQTSSTFSTNYELRSWAVMNSDGCKTTLSMSPVIKTAGMFSTQVLYFCRCPKSFYSTLNANPTVKTFSFVTACRTGHGLSPSNS